MKKARYIRTSSKSQSSLRQEKKAYPDELIYMDVISGSVPFNQRPAGMKLLCDILIQDIKYITFHDISRAGRNTIDVLNTLKHFQDRGITVKIENLGIESMIEGKPNPVFNLLTTVLAEIYSMERTTLLERQQEGIAIAKANGTYTGRVKGSVESDKIVLAKYPAAVKAIKNHPELSLRKLAKLGECSENTIKKLKAIIKN
jgi:DNA invertase Pin-like site-specific DNA recombinase